MKKAFCIALLGLSATAFAGDKPTFWEDSKHLLSRERHCDQLAKGLSDDLTYIEEYLWASGFSKLIDHHLSSFIKDVNIAMRDGCVSKSRAASLNAELEAWRTVLSDLRTQYYHKEIDGKGFFHEVRKRIDAANKPLPPATTK